MTSWNFSLRILLLSCLLGNKTQKKLLTLFIFLPTDSDRNCASGGHLMATEPLCLLILRCPEKTLLPWRMCPSQPPAKHSCWLLNQETPFSFFSPFSRMFYNSMFPHIVIVRNYVFMLLWILYDYILKTLFPSANWSLLVWWLAWPKTFRRWEGQYYYF